MHRIQPNEEDRLLRIEIDYFIEFIVGIFVTATQLTFKCQVVIRRPKNKNWPKIVIEMNG